MSLNVLDPRFAVPYSVNYNLTIQRELPGQMILSVGYVGSQGRHLERAFELNPAIPGACAAIGPTCDGNTGLRAFQGVFPRKLHEPVDFPGSIGPNTPNGILFVGSVGQQATDGNSKYNSLQASLNKRISHGLTFTLSYTYAHAQDDGSSFENSSFGVRGTNPFINQLNWGDSRALTRGSASWLATNTSSRLLIRSVRVRSAKYSEGGELPVTPHSRPASQSI